MGFNNINPFSDSDDNTSFERGMPVNNAAKTAANNAAKTVTTQTDKQIQDALNQVLYGPSTPPTEDKGTDEANPTPTDHTTASQGANKQAAAGKNSNQTPEEQAKMEKIRHELFGNYSLTFRAAAVNGAQNIITGVDMEMDRERKKREQEEMQKKQEEEQEEEQKKQEEEEAAQEQLAMPAGKKTGMQMGRKQQEPIALRLSKTKTEINRGATG